MRTLEKPLNSEATHQLKENKMDNLNINFGTTLEQSASSITCGRYGRQMEGYLTLREPN